MAISAGAGGIGVTNAMVGTGERAVFQPITPCRMVDTRAGQNVHRGTPLGPQEKLVIDVTDPTGNCDDLFDAATGLVLNVNSGDIVVTVTFSIGANDGAGYNCAIHSGTSSTTVSGSYQTTGITPSGGARVGHTHRRAFVGTAGVQSSFRVVCYNPSGVSDMDVRHVFLDAVAFPSKTP